MYVLQKLKSGNFLGFSSTAMLVYALLMFNQSEGSSQGSKQQHQQWRSMQWHAMACNGMQWRAMACNGMQWHAMACNGMQWHAMACNGMQWHAMACNGM
jgi:hypothetical protein